MLLFILIKINRRRNNEIQQVKFIQYIRAHIRKHENNFNVNQTR